MKCLQKTLVVCALSLALISPAKATLALTFQAAPAVLLGVASIGVSIAGTTGGIVLVKQGKTIPGTLAILGSIAIGLWGFAVLDGDQEAQFSELTPEGAAALGLAPEQREIYNSEVEQVNAIAREIGSELMRLGSDSPELARDMWIDLGTQLSPETMKTVIAIVNQQ